MHTQYQLRNKIYSVVDCSVEDIPSHIERVSSYWEESNTDIWYQSQLMKLAIDEGLALRVLDNTEEERLAIYIVLHRNSEHTANGCLLYTKDNRSLAMALDVYKRDKEIAKIFFMPHKLPPVPFSDIVEISSIRKYHDFRKPLEVDLQKGKALSFINKYFNLYDIQRV